MKSTDLTAETLRALLDYELDGGIFRWRVSRQRIQIGAVAGAVNSDGYIVIRINGTLFKAHRLAWLYTHGVMPTHDIDHLNGNKADNRITNLRDVSRSVNMQNQTRAGRGSASGLLGVSWNKRVERWHASIWVNKRKQHIGYFNTADEAHAAYLAAKLQLHPGDVRNLTEIPS